MDGRPAVLRAAHWHRCHDRPCRVLPPVLCPPHVPVHPQCGTPGALQRQPPGALRVDLDRDALQRGAAVCRRRRIPPGARAAMILPDTDDVLASIIDTFDRYIAPQVVDDYAASLCLTVSQLPRSLRARMRTADVSDV